MTDAPDTEHDLYLRWLAKRDAAVAAREQAHRERGARISRELEMHASVTLGRASNDGTGHCRWCRIALGTDPKGQRTHPVVRECSGPAPDPCGLCGGLWRWNTSARQWHHDCGGPRSAAPRVRQLERVRNADSDSGGDDDSYFGFRRRGEP